MSGHSMLAELRGLAPGGVSLAFPKQRLGLHAMLTSVGYDRVAGRPYDWDGRRRGEAPFVLLQHTLAGRGRLLYEGRRFELRAGQAMLLQFPHDNRYWLGRGDTWEFFWLALNGREVLRIWREVLAVCGPVATLSEAAVEQLAKLALVALRGEAATPAQASALAYTVAMAVADDLLPWGQPRLPAERPAAVERAVSLCQAHAFGHLDVDQMARAAGYSRYHFTRVFTAHEGMSPARYLLRLRMAEAARLLRVDSAPIKSIAARCGFADANYFAKVFRRSYGMGPKDFRRSGMFAGAPPPTP